MSTEIGRYHLRQRYIIAVPVPTTIAHSTDMVGEGETVLVLRDSSILSKDGINQGKVVVTPCGHQ